MRAFAMRSWNTVSPQVVRFVRRRPLLKATAAAGGLVCAQLSYIQYNYVPLKPPLMAATSGMATWREGANSEASDTDDRPKPRQTKRVLIIGDSLVVGIGCTHEAVMPQALCKRLAEHLQADISWHTHGINGADIRTMHRDILQHFREHQPQLYRILSRVIPESHREDSLEVRPTLAQMAADADVVVVMCGLNDFKRVWMGRTASVFRRDLDGLLRLLRERSAPECLVVLPALPLEETRLPQPLKSFAIYLAARFDAVKREAAAADALVRFIPKPAVDLWHRARERAAAAGGGLLARDGVHPNEAGYEAFGEYLGRELAALMLLPREGSMEAVARV